MVCVAQVDQEVRLPAPVREEFRVDLGVVKPRHRSGIKPKRRAARMKYAPCNVPLRNACVRVNSSWPGAVNMSANCGMCGNKRGMNS